MNKAPYASEIEEIETSSIWGGRLPEKAITVLFGESGTGKSTLARHLVCCLTNGTALPDGQQLPAPVGVIWISNEEDTQSVLVPQLRKCGADLSKVRILSKIKPEVSQVGEASERKFDAANRRDLAALRQAIWDNPEDNIGLVIIDAARGMGSKSISYPKPCREMLEGLQKVAEETSVAILLLHHTNRRSSSKTPIDRIAGSGEMYNFPRCVLMLTKDESDDNKIILSVPKPFLCTAPPPITYRQEAGEIEFLQGIIPEKVQEWEEAEAVKLDEAIMCLLSKAPGKPFAVRQVAAATKHNYDAVAKQLQRLHQAGKVEKPAYGYYCVSSNSSSVAKVGHVQVPAPNPQAVPGGGKVRVQVSN